MSIEVDSNFWQGKKVLITGHTGFKGAWLSLWLHKMGADVVGFSVDIPTEPSLYKAANVEKFVDSYEGDLINKNEIANVVASTQPEIVFHLAAQSLVRKSYEDPLYTFEVNVMGTATLLEAIRKTDSVKACVVVTSDKCYENQEWDWGYRESEAMGGYDAYSASKGCAELLVSAYRRSFFSSNDDGSQCAIATARAGNVIGGGDWAEDRLVPSILASLSESKPVSIRSPKSVRPWQHVLEPLSGYMMLAQALYNDGDKFAQGWNFGPPDSGAKPVSWMADKFVEFWESGTWTFETFDNLHEAKQLKLDSSKARAELGWEPVWNPAEAIKMTIDWHKVWLTNTDMSPISYDQIDCYVSGRQSLT